MFTTIYINNRREAAVVARVARQFGRKASIKDIYEHDRYLLNVSERLFGMYPEKTEFIKQCADEIKHLRNNK